MHRGGASSGAERRKSSLVGRTPVRPLEWPTAGRPWRHILTAAGLAATRLVLDSALAAPDAHAATAPAIFYSPHQDDEAIGLAGSILEHKAAGRPVYLVLVTRGENGGLAEYMNQGACKSLGNNCSAPGHYHSLGWDEAWPTPEVVVGRTAEFKLSAKALGVDKVINFDLSDEADGDFDGFVQKVIAKVRSLAKQYPGASHKFAAGWLDGNATHKACSDAAYWLMKNGELTDVRFNHIYTYQQYPNPADRNRGASYVLNIPDAHVTPPRRKRRGFSLALAGVATDQPGP
ncbi:PIG-L family deacetylase [Kitasatospora sp. NBC_01300]|uniref:PIG-L deacetylase family protein n=1 Tax=Kitasatospora sp. NBC_01300 TaxID=2903574 RepID=UPI002F911EA7|nr:PIG-L family deacetylase [Kitasatospora sp. NBC_01300]